MEKEAARVCWIITLEGILDGKRSSWIKSCYVRLFTTSVYTSLRVTGVGYLHFIHFDKYEIFVSGEKPRKTAVGGKASGPYWKLLFTAAQVVRVLPCCRVSAGVRGRGARAARRLVSSRWGWRLRGCCTSGELLSRCRGGTERGRRVGAWVAKKRRSDL